MSSIQAHHIQDPEPPLAKKVIGNTSIEIYQGDLLKQPVDAIVNPANTSLNGGGGVDGLIGKAAGRSIYQECQDQLKLKNLTLCQTGDAYITGSGNLTSRGITHVIHAVGPICSTDNRDELLKKAYYNSLLRAHEAGLESIAFPAISIGIFGFPPDRAAEIADQAIAEFCADNPDTTLTQIRLVFWTGSQDIQSLERMRQLFASKQ